MFTELAGTREQVPFDTTIGPKCTKHSRLRKAHRGISDQDIRYVLIHGTEVWRAGASFFILRRIDIPTEDRKQWHRLVGTVVVVDSTGEFVTTVYRNAKAFKRIRKKPKCSRNWADEQSLLSDCSIM